MSIWLYEHGKHDAAYLLSVCENLESKEWINSAAKRGELEIRGAGLSCSLMPSLSSEILSQIILDGVSVICLKELV